MGRDELPRHLRPIVGFEIEGFAFRLFTLFLAPTLNPAGGSMSVNAILRQLPFTASQQILAKVVTIALVGSIWPPRCKAK
jgi:hypothetical protein